MIDPIRLTEALAAASEHIMEILAADPECVALGTVGEIEMPAGEIFRINIDIKPAAGQ